MVNYVSTFLDFFGPTHPTSAKSYLAVPKLLSLPISEVLAMYTHFTMLSATISSRRLKGQLHFLKADFRLRANDDQVCSCTKVD